MKTILIGIYIVLFVSNVANASDEFPRRDEHSQYPALEPLETADFEPNLERNDKICIRALEMGAIYSSLSFMVRTLIYARIANSTEFLKAEVEAEVRAAQESLGCNIVVSLHRLAGEGPDHPWTEATILQVFGASRVMSEDLRQMHAQREELEQAVIDEALHSSDLRGFFENPSNPVSLVWRHFFNRVLNSDFMVFRRIAEAAFRETLASRPQMSFEQILVIISALQSINTAPMYEPVAFISTRTITNMFQFATAAQLSTVQPTPAEICPVDDLPAQAEGGGNCCSKRGKKRARM